MPVIASIGYEHATPAALVAELRRAGVGLLVDVRAVPNSRRPGFSKKALGAALDEAGIGYLHLRALGTPADGRTAARSGKHAEMHRIFRKQLDTPEAQDALEMLDGLVAGPRKVCLLCLEADHTHCHRTLVIEALDPDGLTVEHLKI